VGGPPLGSTRVGGTALRPGRAPTPRPAPASPGRWSPRPRRVQPSTQQNRPKADRDTARLSILEAVVYGICRENTTREQANQALARFKDEFFDWNEVRVSSLDEIQESLAGIPEPEERARRIRRFLRQLFQRTYGFSALEALAKKPLKDALKVLQTYDAFASDYVTATVVQKALGGHAMPIDENARRVLERLGIAEATIPELRAVLERAVPKNRGAEFLDLLEDLAHDTCVEGEPEYQRCELRKICAFALARKQEASDSTPTGRAIKSRPPKGKDKDKDATKPPKAKGAEVAPPAPASPAKKSTPARAAKEMPPPAKPPRGKHGTK
jgi:endonuclease III